MTNLYINRRNFLKGTTAALALSSFGAYGLELMHAAKKWRVGLVGAGWYGKSDLFRLIQVANVEVVSLCDVDENHLKGAADMVAQRQKSGKRPRLYKNYRKMLAERDLDIVLIATPDHWHALQAIEAIKSGAHVYLQKPISVDVSEGEAILAAARKYGKTVQIGTQRRSTPHLIEGKKNIIEQGLLGNIAHVEMCCYYHMRFNGNPPLKAVPEFFDYDLWTGPAPPRSFQPRVFASMAASVRHSFVAAAGRWRCWSGCDAWPPYERWSGRQRRRPIQLFGGFRPRTEER